MKLVSGQRDVPQVDAAVVNMKVGFPAFGGAQRILGRRKSEFPVKAPLPCLRLSTTRSRMEMSEVFTESHTLSSLLSHKGFSGVFSSPSESLHAHGQKIEPHVRLRSPAKRPGAGRAANAVMRTPFSSSLLPPPSLHSLWTTPKQEVHFLFFLKKKRKSKITLLHLALSYHAPQIQQHISSVSFLKQTHV